jgi:hypothetical protein
VRPSVPGSINASSKTGRVPQVFRNKRNASALGVDVAVLCGGRHGEQSSKRNATECMRWTTEIKETADMKVDRRQRCATPHTHARSTKGSFVTVACACPMVTLLVGIAESVALRNKGLGVVGMQTRQDTHSSEKSGTGLQA